MIEKGPYLREDIALEILKWRYPNAEIKFDCCGYIIIDGNCFGCLRDADTFYRLFKWAIYMWYAE